MIKLIINLWNAIGIQRQNQFKLIIFLMVINAFFEIVSLGAVLPFLGVLISPEKVYNYPLIMNFSEFLGIKNTDELTLLITIGFILSSLIAGTVRMLLLWVNTRFTVECGSDLSYEAYRRTLYQPYSVQISRNSSEIISGITQKVNGAVFGVLLPLLNLISSIILLIAIVGTIIIIDAYLAIIVAVVFGSTYTFISWISKKHLLINSRQIDLEQNQVIKVMQEGLGGIRDVLLDGTQSLYAKIYRQSDIKLRVAQGSNLFIGQSPRYIIETLGMVLIAVSSYILSSKEGGISTALPVLGVLALGAQRLLPALQQIYSAWSSVVGSHASLNETINLIQQPLPFEIIEKNQVQIVFSHSIRFNSVSFKYKKDTPFILNGFNLTIPKGARVGLVGSTGSGKSTTFDILMGLLEPTEGTVLIDERPLSINNLREWQKLIAHVPQTIYLADCTLAENIAFGVPFSEIDMNRVRRAAEQAQIADFIESTPEGYEIIVGERGVRLSGGQKQRIGIARALYKNSKVLLFDEATSALDNKTEKSIMSTIEALGRDVTILIIAHRLSTVQSCDFVVELAGGKIIAQGDYSHLLKISSSFSKMAGKL